jgi:hypothetical protein
MAEFQVVYPDSTSVYSLSATPTTKSSLNSAGLSVEDASYKSTLANDNLVIESVGVGGVAHTLGWNEDGFTMDAQLQIDGVVAGENLTTKMSGENGLVITNETIGNSASYDATGVSAYNSGSTLSNIMSYESNTITSGDDVATLGAASLTYANATRTATVNPNEIKIVDPNAGDELFAGITPGTIQVLFQNVAAALNAGEIKATTNASGGGVNAQFGRILPDRMEMGNNTDPDDSILSTWNPEALQFFRDGNAANITMAANGTKLTSSSFQPSSLLDVSGNAGVDGQYLLSNGTAPVWTTVSAPAVPNLAAVLAVATAGDAEDQPISNLSSLGFEATAGGQAVLAITAKASSKPAATFDVMNLPYAADATTGRVFSNQYVEISVAGTSYWVQLFSAPPAP